MAVHIKKFEKLEKVPAGVLLLLMFTCLLMVITFFQSPASHAEVAVAPSSYVATDVGPTIVQGQPAVVDGKAVTYHKVNFIPIKPKFGQANETHIDLNTRCHAANIDNQSVCDTNGQ